MTIKSGSTCNDCRLQREVPRDHEAQCALQALAGRQGQALLVALLRLLRWGAQGEGADGSCRNRRDLLGGLATLMAAWDASLKASMLCQPLRLDPVGTLEITLQKEKLKMSQLSQQANH